MQYSTSNYAEDTHFMKDESVLYISEPQFEFWLFVAYFWPCALYIFLEEYATLGMSRFHSKFLEAFCDFFSIPCAL